MAKTLDQFPEHLQKIALLAIESNNIDFYLELLFRTITGIQPDLSYAIFGAVHSQRVRREILLEVAAVELKKYPHLIKQLEKLMDRMGKAARKRAEIVHAIYVRPFGKIKVPITYQPYERGAKVARIGDLNQAIKQITSLNNDLRRFGMAVRKERGRRMLENTWPPP